MRVNLIRREGTNGFNAYKPVSIVHSPALGAAQIASAQPVKQALPLYTLYSRRVPVNYTLQ